MNYREIMTSIDTQVEDVMLKALRSNLNYKNGERVVLVTQRWDPKFGEETKPIFDRAIELNRQLRQSYVDAGVDVELFTYVPEEARSGVNPTDELYEMIKEYEKSKGVPDIVIAPAAYSITHTDFRIEQNERGSRIATMSNSSLAMFQLGGPMDVQGDYNEVVEKTEKFAENMRNSDYVKITGPGTDLVVNIDRNLVDASTGFVEKPGDCYNWLGAEANAVPVHEGNSWGHFTVLSGWGGRVPLEHKVIFYIDGGRFVDAVGETEEAQAYIDEYVKPMIFDRENFDIVAELGIGTNDTVSERYLLENWSIAVGEKMGGTVHIAHGNSKAMGGVNDVQEHQDFVIRNIDNIVFGYQPQK